MYDDIDQLTNSIDWQDILDTALTIVDENGKLYKWDKSLTNEIATVYGYTLKEIGVDTLLSSLCVERNKNENYATEFIL